MLQIIYLYTLLLHVALPAILFVLYGDGAAETAAPSWTTFVKDPWAWSALGLAMIVVLLSHFLPKHIARAGSGVKSVGTAYLVKICLLECSVVLGFILGMLKQTPELSLPFAAIGLALVLMAPPRESTFAKFRGHP